MSLTFPRDMTSAARWERADLVLQHRQELSRTAGGDAQAQDIGPAIWRADYATVPILAAEARAYYADLLTLRGAARTFYLVPIPSAPAARDGEALTGIEVESIATNNDALALRGLPAGFEMRAGDYLSIETGAGGRELHMLHSGATADAQGVTGEMIVVPHVRPVVSTGDTVTLVSPLVEMRLEPDSLRHERLSPLHSRVSFQATQVIR